MTYIPNWEEFAKAAERIYLTDPMNCRFVIKYRHCTGELKVKITDDTVMHFTPCIFLAINVENSFKIFSMEIIRDKAKPFDCVQYRTEHAQDIKRLEKLTNQLMRHMASKEGK